MIKLDKSGKHRVIRTDSTLPEMTTESGTAYRKTLLASGAITPDNEVYGPWDRPFMGKETVQRYRDRLIQTGFLIPNHEAE